MNKVAIYCRLSDEDRKKANSFDDSESIQNQKNLLTMYALENELDIYKIYSDDDFSGLDSHRPEWNQMLKDAEAQKFSIILCKSQSRFTRDMEVVEKYLHNKFIEWGIRFIGLADNSDTSNKGNKKQRQIMGLTNEWYCEDVSENIRAVFDNKRNEGKFIGSFACYGYKKDSKDKNSLIIDDEAAGVVRTIYNWYLEGYGTQHIAFMLNEKGIPNPTKYKQNAGLNFKNPSTNNYGHWNKTTVKRILKNEMYIGNMVQGKRKKVNYKSKKIVSTAKDQWVKVENTHEPVVEERVFDEVQRRINQRQRSTGEGQAHIFSTKLKCADCGSTMHKVTTFRGGKRAYSYLRCKIYAATGNKDFCTSHSVRLDLLRSHITAKLKEHINYYLDENTIARKLQLESDKNNKINNLKNEILTIKRQLENTSQALKNLYLDKMKGVITNEQFIELNKGFSTDNEGSKRRKENIEHLLFELKQKSLDMDEWISIVRGYKDFKELTHTMVSEFIDYIEIGENNNASGEQIIKIHWLF